MRVRHPILVAAMAAAVTFFTATPASAAVSTPYLWKYSSAQFGYCGVTSGGQIKAIQAMLWAGHYYVRTIGGSMETTKSQVDGYFGNRTYNALRLFQQEHGLGVDGCAGPNTLDRLQQYLSPYGTSTTLEAKLYTGGRQWKLPWYPELIGFYYQPCCDYNQADGVWRFQWFNGCFTMRSPSVYTGYSCT
jgi:peptidoglycan hydrolase-like protein with peptidoglycan-binding domain